MRACEGKRARGTARVGKASLFQGLQEESSSFLPRGCVWQYWVLVCFFPHAGQRRLRQLAAMGMQLSWRCECSSWWSSSSWIMWIRSSTTTEKPALQRTLVTTSLSHSMCHLSCTPSLTVSPSTNISRTSALTILTDSFKNTLSLIPHYSSSLHPYLQHFLLEY